MKKYISPKSILVELDNEALIAESLRVIIDDEEEINDASQILSKEITSKNLWDEEW